MSDLIFCLNSTYIPTEKYVNFSFPLNDETVLIDSKLKKNRKHRGYHRVVFLDTLTNKSCELFYNKKYKAGFNVFKKALKNIGYRIINTSIDASGMY